MSAQLSHERNTTWFRLLGISQEDTEDSIMDMLEAVVRPKRVLIVRYPGAREHAGYAWVDMPTREDVVRVRWLLSQSGQFRSL